MGQVMAGSEKSQPITLTLHQSLNLILGLFSFLAAYWILVRAAFASFVTFFCFSHDSSHCSRCIASAIHYSTYPQESGDNVWAVRHVGKQRKKTAKYNQTSPRPASIRRIVVAVVVADQAVFGVVVLTAPLNRLTRSRPMAPRPSGKCCALVQSPLRPSSP